MCPSIGLKSAVIVVGGCDGSPFVVEDSGEDEFGIWNEGGVASGMVVNRIPVETEERGGGGEEMICSSP